MERILHPESAHLLKQILSDMIAKVMNTISSDACESCRLKPKSPPEFYYIHIVQVTIRNFSYSRSINTHESMELPFSKINF